VRMEECRIIKSHLPINNACVHRNPHVMYTLIIIYAVLLTSALSYYSWHPLNSPHPRQFVANNIVIKCNCFTPALFTRDHYFLSSTTKISLLKGCHDAATSEDVYFGGLTPLLQSREIRHYWHNNLKSYSCYCFTYICLEKITVIMRR
jgi:hypothetical protein